MPTAMEWVRAAVLLLVGATTGSALTLRYCIRTLRELQLKDAALLERLLEQLRSVRDEARQPPSLTREGNPALYAAIAEAYQPTVEPFVVPPLSRVHEPATRTHEVKSAIPLPEE